MAVLQQACISDTAPTIAEASKDDETYARLNLRMLRNPATVTCSTAALCRFPAMSPAPHHAADSGWSQGAMTLTASFDEFNLDLEAAYPGEPLAFPNKRPSMEEVRDNPDGVR
jgi:hypothetical protein